MEQINKQIRTIVVDRLIDILWQQSHDKLSWINWNKVDNGIWMVIYILMFPINIQTTNNI